VKQIDVAVIGTGWCGGIRAEACANYPTVRALHIAETRAERLAEVARATGARTATADYRRLLDDKAIEAVFVCATPETTHFPIARDCLLAGKHAFLEKPIALELGEADELIAVARRAKVKFTIGYSQRFNPKYAYIKKCIADGMLGRPVSALVSRHITRNLGKKISGRIKLSPAAMEATHDLDFVLWCLQPATPVRVYAQAVYQVMRPTHGVADCMWIMVTLDDGVVITVGAGWIMPPAYPNFSSTWIEFVGSEGSLLVDDTHRDVVLNTMTKGTVFPISTMPGEPLGHVFAGPMAAETLHFVDAVAFDRLVLVTPEQARTVMDVYTAADLSAERNAPVSVPLARPNAPSSATIQGRLTNETITDGLTPANEL
jgi:predicted dehydrogenase